MKRLLPIFELSKNEQRVVLIVMFVLIAVAFITYERRFHYSPPQPISATETKASPSPAESKNEQ
jgi:hypothetical protein